MAPRKRTEAGLDSPNLNAQAARFLDVLKSGRGSNAPAGWLPAAALSRLWKMPLPTVHSRLERSMQLGLFERQKFRDHTGHSRWHYRPR